MTLHADVWGLPFARLPLVVERSGEVPASSGLNWGQRDGRAPNQAYLAVPARYQRKADRDGFFPPIGVPFRTRVDRGTELLLVSAQANGKALQSQVDNEQLGLYFRRVLGVTPGAPVLREHLDAFGERYVTFYRLNFAEYLMEFEPQ